MATTEQPWMNLYLHSGWATTRQFLHFTAIFPKRILFPQGEHVSGRITWRDADTESCWGCVCDYYSFFLTLLKVARGAGYKEFTDEPVWLCTVFETKTCLVGLSALTVALSSIFVSVSGSAIVSSEGNHTEVWSEGHKSPEVNSFITEWMNNSVFLMLPLLLAEKTFSDDALRTQNPYNSTNRGSTSTSGSSTYYY